MQHSHIISLLWWLAGCCHAVLARDPSDVLMAGLVAYYGEFIIVYRNTPRCGHNQRR